MPNADFFVWKDLIVLKLHDPFPLDNKGNPDPEQAIAQYPGVEDFCRYSDKFKGFLFALSVGNLKRIHATFGKIPVTGGQHYIEQLRIDYRQYQITAKRIEEIKTAPIESLPKINYKLPPLAEYQHRETIFLTEIPQGPLFADCGMGKTFCVLVSTEEQFRRGIVPRGKVLIAAKLATLFNGWLKDAQKFTNLKVVCLWEPSSKKKKDNVRRKLLEDADVYLINHDGVRVFEDELMEKGFEKVVVDESTVLKSFRSERAQKGGAFGKALMNVSRTAGWRVAMSGTPASNGIEDLWGQFKFLDPRGFTLEPSFIDFRSLYMREVKFGRDRIESEYDARGNVIKSEVKKAPSKWVQTLDGAEAVSKLIRPVSFRVKMEDHLKDLPPKTVMQREVKMSPQQEMHYEKLASDFFTEIDNEKIIVSIKLSLMGKFSQVTGGFLYDVDKVAHPIGEENPKLLEMDSILEDEIGDKKVVVFAQHSYEIETIYSRYKSRNPVTVYGDNYSKVNLANIDKFLEDPSVGMLILHPKSAAHGITLVNSHHMIFFSTSFSAEDDYQAVKRIERNGQKHPMIIYYLLCQDSIDEYKFEVVQRKHENQSALIDEGRVLDSKDVVDEVWDEMKEHLRTKYPKLAKKHSKGGKHYDANRETPTL